MHKTAAGISPEAVAQATQVNRAPDLGMGAKGSALKMILASLLGGAALGGTVTGLSGLSKLRKQPPSTPSDVEVDVPYPQKAAADVAGLLGDMSPVKILSPEWWKSLHAHSAAEVPWLIPGMVGAAGAGTLGTSALVEHLIKKKRKAMLDQDMQAAQGRFNESMLGQFKQSSANDPLDKVFDKLAANAGADWSRTATYAPLIAGGALTAGGLLAALAARGAYKSQEGKTQEDLLQKALKQRAYLQAMRSPPPITLEPKPVSGE